MVEMTPAGQALTHFAQPTHLAGSTAAYSPLYTQIAPSGQLLAHAPQATHSFVSTEATLLLAFMPIPLRNIRDY